MHANLDEDSDDSEESAAGLFCEGGEADAAEDGVAIEAKSELNDIEAKDDDTEVLDSALRMN